MEYTRGLTTVLTHNQREHNV